MKKHFLLSLAAISFVSFQSNAQLHKCGTVGTRIPPIVISLPPEPGAPAVIGLVNVNKPTSSVEIKVQFHVVCSGNVSTAPVTPTQIATALSYVNTKFAPSQLNFVQCSSIDYILNSPLYNTFTMSENQQMEIGKHDKTHCINIYYFTRIENGEVDGFSYIPGAVTYAYISSYSHTRINLATSDNNGAVNLANVMAHEMGHYFGLYHTNGDNYGTDEYVDGSNGTTAGDLVGDTPADPAFDVYHSANGPTCTYPVGSPNCSSTPSFCDANPNMSPGVPHVFQPLSDNIMYPTPYDCNINFTQGQIDRIYNTYYNYFRDELTGAADLVSRDNVWDPGHEPYVGFNYIGQLPDLDVWQSPDIWNCRTTGTCLEDNHESPGYLTPNKNSLRVRVTNRGCATSTPAQLHAYWTLGSTGETWSSSWINKTLCGTLAGDEIPNLPLTTPRTYGQTIPALTSGTEAIFTFDWYPIDPATGFSCLPSGLSKYADGNPMICLLSRIVSSNDPMHNEQLGRIGPNISNNNNIVTRNTSLVRMTAHKSVPGNGSTVLVENAGIEAAAYDLHLRDISSTRGDYAAHAGAVIIWLSDNLWDAWSNSGRDGEGGSIFNETEHLILVSSPDAVLKNLDLQPGEVYKAAFSFEMDSPTDDYPVESNFMFYQSLPSESDAEITSACLFKVVVEEGDGEALKSTSGTGAPTTGNALQQGNDNNLAKLGKGQLMLYPNPANQSATLEFNMATAGAVDISMTDLAGRTVAHFAVNQYLSAGRHAEKISLKEYSSGLYFLRIKSAAINESIRFTIRKD